MTKQENRYYILCVDFNSDILYVAVSKHFDCGHTYYDATEYAKKFDKNLIIKGFNQASSLKHSLKGKYKRELKRGQRPKIFLKRIMGSAVEILLNGSK